MNQQQQLRWHPTSKQVLWTVGTGVAVIVLIRICYAYQWTGFGQSHVNPDLQPAKTLWDWLQLLIIPTVLAGGTIWFNRRQQQRDQRRSEQRAQDDALQAYLDHMSRLLADKEQPLSSAQLNDKLSTMARARTLTALTRLDGERKRSVLQFLFDSGLIYRHHSHLNESGLIESQHPIVSLSQANLSEAKLSGATLIGAYLGEADLSGADLSWASLFKAVLGGANLSRANLSRADLSKANLSGVSPSGDNVFGANLRDAILSGANLSGANLGGADLSGSLLSGAMGVTNKELHQQASSLKGTIMPNGQKYEEWLKDKEGCGDDGVSTGPS